MTQLFFVRDGRAFAPIRVVATRTIDLAEFIRCERTAILQKWEERVRQLSHVAQAQDATLLIDHLPALLETIAAAASTTGTSSSAPDRTANLHATERLEQGYALAEVVMEYVELRTCIFERLDELELVIEPRQSRKLHRAIDHALRETARRYMTAHEKMLRAMDRIAGVQTPTRALDEVLADILHALKETAGADVDSIAILLLEDDGRLHLRATVGFEQELEQRYATAIGEAFPGRVAQTKKPLLLHDAAHDPFVAPPVRHRGTRALYGVPLVDGGRVVGVAHIGSCTATDFSEEDMMLFRAMCERATTAIVRATFVEALERTARFREQFVAVLGHDLRSPLNAILGTAQLLLENEEAPARLRTAHERIARSATRMERLIAQLLDFTRARLGGGFALEPKPMSLLAVCREVADEVAPALSRRELRVEGDDVHGEWDRDHIAQVIANLVTNAIKHTPDGSHIRVHVHLAENGEARVDVWNDGPPIPPGTKLFEPFERGTRSGDGLGLGLYIAYEIVHAHRGALSVRSDDSGTTFTIRMPRSVEGLREGR